MNEEKAMLQLTNIKLQMEVAGLNLALATTREMIRKQAQRIHELEASYTSGIKIIDGEYHV